MPGISGAQRNLSPAPPAQRNAWYCLRCKSRNEPMGHGQNAKAAELAGIRHFLITHDTSRTEART